MHWSIRSIRDAADRERGVETLTEVRGMCRHDRFHLSELPAIDTGVLVETLLDRTADGDVTEDTAISLGFEGHMAWAEAM